MSQPSSKRKRSEQTVETRNKWPIIIAISAVVLIVIAAIAYFAWPKAPTPSVTELKIEDLVVGTGKEAKAGDTITVEYTGWLEPKYNIQSFDSPNLHDKPFQFVLGKGEVIAGWDQGLVGMKVDGKRKLIVPPDLAYGADGAMEGRIPPNSTLIFEITLLGDQGPAAATLPPSSVTELKIEDLVVGTGAEAKDGDTLSVHYTGWLENGTKFDSSLDSGQPIEFVLGKGKVIPGWEQGLKGMKVGGKRRLTVPSSLGYGPYGAGDTIPPNATLIFEVELLAIK
jgi:peptidylprolyl isomerase